MARVVSKVLRHSTAALQTAHLSERAQHVMQLAENEAARMHHNYVGTEHVLLGLLREGEGVASTALRDAGIDLNKVRATVEQVIGKGKEGVKPPKYLSAMTPRTRRVLELAVDEARQLRHQLVGTEDLLLGMLREGEGIAAGVLVSMGVDFPAMRARIIDTAVRVRDAVVSARIDVHDLSAIDALVEAGVRTTRSDAAAWLIKMGIDSQRELFNRVSANVAQIRRLREESRQLTEPGVAPATPDEPPVSAGSEALADIPPAER